MEINCGNKGLCNLGNTCYINSALQCLSHLIEFHPKNDIFIKELTLHKVRSPLMKEWYDLLDAIWSTTSNNPINPTPFLKEFINQASANNIDFHNFHQNDTEEFINIILDLLHKSIKKKLSISISGDIKTNMDRLGYKSINEWLKFFKNDNSYIIQKFYSQLLSITTCSHCDTSVTNHEPIMVLSLEIKDCNTIYDCLKSFTKHEILDSNNQWKCDKCNNLNNPEKKILLWNTSDVLIILLKRFTNSLKKI